MALYHQLKFPTTFIEYRSVSEWKGVLVVPQLVKKFPALHENQKFITVLTTVRLLSLFRVI